jgi:hypothetical protein
VTVQVGLARARRVSLVVRDQHGRAIGRRTVRLRRADLFDYHVPVRPRGGVTPRTRWRVVATATGPGGQVTRKSVSFRPRR